MARTNSLPTVSIIIVNFNGRHLLKDCLTTVYQTNYPKSKYEVVVVDNCSSDDSISYITKNFPSTHIVALEENKGFAGGNIEGLKATTGEYIVLLNNDTKVEKDWLTYLVESARPSNIGLVSPKLFYATPFLELTINCNIISLSDINYGTDFSPVGIIMENITCRNEELTNQVWYKSGFYEKKDGMIISRWTKGHSTV
jgi:GT2 family glycosyltransferase